MLKDTLPEIQKEIAVKRAKYDEELWGLAKTCLLLAREDSNLAVSWLHSALLCGRPCTARTPSGMQGFSLRARLEQLCRNFSTALEKTRLAGIVGQKGESVVVTTNGMQLPGIVVKVKVNEEGAKVFEVMSTSTVEGLDEFLDHDVEEVDCRISPS